MNDDQWEIINQRLNSIQQTIDRTDRDLELDRKDLQEFALRLGKVENQLIEVLKIVNHLPERTKNIVANVVQPIEKEAHNLKESIERKKVLAFNKLRGRNWFSRLIGR